MLYALIFSSHVAQNRVFTIKYRFFQNRADKLERGTLEPIKSGRLSVLYVNLTGTWFLVRFDRSILKIGLPLPQKLRYFGDY